MSESMLTDTDRMMVRAREKDRERVNHPAHYGGGDDPYEAIKVIDAWDLGFCLGNTVKYIRRATNTLKPRSKDEALTDLKKALWYLQHELEEREKLS